MSVSRQSLRFERLGATSNPASAVAKPQNTSSKLVEKNEGCSYGTVFINDMHKYIVKMALQPSLGALFILCWSSSYQLGKLGR